MRYEPHWTILGLGGAKCDGCGVDLAQLQAAWSEPVGEYDVRLTCRTCKEGGR